MLSIYISLKFCHSVEILMERQENAGTQDFLLFLLLFPQILGANSITIETSIFLFANAFDLHKSKFYYMVGG